MIWKKYQKSRRTIGVMINQMEGRYYNTLWRGFNDVAQSNDCNIIFFDGRSLQSPYEGENQQNSVYELIDLEQIDGLIVTSGTLANFVGESEFLEFLKPFKSVPMISLSMFIDGVPSIVLDNKKSMKDIIRHMINVHHYKRIAFIRGPVISKDAEERFEVYKEVLEEFKIPYDPELVVQGDFRLEAGIRAVQILMDERKVKFDVIVSSNDMMGLSALEELKERGVKVPEDVALSGFDDIVEAQTISPPFTTVNQMRYNQARKSVEMLIDLMDGKDVAELMIYPGRVLFRQSCGCLPLADLFELTPSVVKQKASKLEIGEFEKTVTDHKEKIINDLLQVMELSHADKSNYFSFFEELVDSFQSEIKGQKESGQFLKSLNDIMNKIVTSEDIMDNWNNAIFIMRTNMLNILANSDMRLLADNLFQKAQILTGDILRRFESTKRTELSLQLLSVRKMNQKINSTFDINELLNSIMEGLEEIGINECYLSLYQTESKWINVKGWNLPEMSTLMLAYKDGKRLKIDEDKKVFPTRQLFPAWLNLDENRYSYLVKALCNNDNYFGFIVFDQGSQDDIIYGTIREQISSALMSIQLYNKRWEAENKLQETMHALKESEERFREMVTLLPTVIVETNKDLKIIFLNQSGYEAFGLLEKDIKAGTSIKEFVHPDDLSRLEEYCSKVIQGEIPNLNEFRLVKRDGSKINLLSKASPILKNRVIEGVRWSAIDIRPLMANAVSPDDSFFEKYKFTSREKEVLELWTQGYQIKEIAGKLFIAESTVKVHIGSIYERLGVKNKTEFFNFLKDYQVNQFGYESFIFSLLSKLIKD